MTIKPAKTPFLIYFLVSMKYGLGKLIASSLKQINLFEISFNHLKIKI